ncbi:MAG TPA: hypothetical protein VGK44_19820 [Casimicrobiaceae bacterium]|jgi:hypothetical protein
MNDPQVSLERHNRIDALLLSFIASYVDTALLGFAWWSRRVSLARTARALLDGYSCNMNASFP